MTQTWGQQMLLIQTRLCKSEYPPALFPLFFLLSSLPLSLPPVLRSYSM